MWRLWWYDWRYELGTLAEKITLWIVWKLPRYVVYWAFIRVAAYGTTGKYGDTHPDTLSVVEAMKRWER